MVIAVQGAATDHGIEAEVADIRYRQRGTAEFVGKVDPEAELQAAAVVDDGGLQEAQRSLEGAVRQGSLCDVCPARRDPIQAA